jgi:hypothetical protein
MQAGRHRRATGDEGTKTPLPPINYDISNNAMDSEEAITPYQELERVDSHDRWRV